MRRSAYSACLALALAAAGAGAAQEAPRSQFLVLNQERILTDSERGKALLAEEEAARDRLRAEARAIEAAFEAEERRLTEQRAGTDPAAFRKLADDFDARVVAARREQDARAGALAAEFDQRRRQFYAEVGPVLVGVMADFGAQAIFDESSVLISDQALNITDEVIAAIDGTFVPAPPETDAQPAEPATDPAPAEPATDAAPAAPEMDAAPAPDGAPD